MSARQAEGTPHCAWPGIVSGGRHRRFAKVVKLLAIISAAKPDIVFGIGPEPMLIPRYPCQSCRFRCGLRHYLARPDRAVWRSPELAVGADPPFVSVNCRPL